eukprot:6490690-Amphidinium_carterae.2
MDPVQRLSVQHAEQLQLLSLVESKVKEKAHKTLEAYRAAFGHLQSDRRANADWMFALDHALVYGTGRGLRHFLPRKVTGGLQVGQTREVEEIDLPDGTVKRRSVVRDESGDGAVEVPRRYIDGELEQPFLVIAHDQGSIGQAALLHALCKTRLRLVAVPDVFHRLSNDWLQSLTVCDLTGLRFELRALARLKYGSWQSCSNLSLLQGVGKDLSEVHTSAHPVFQVLLEGLAKECGFSVHEQLGIRETELVWERLVQSMEKLHLGERTEFQRWFSFERTGRSILGQRHLLQLLLVHLGMQRRWWSDVSKSPLIAALSEEEVQAKEGAEVVPNPESEGVAQPKAAAKAAASSSSGSKKARKTVISTGTEEEKQVESGVVGKKQGYEYAAAQRKGVSTLLLSCQLLSCEVKMRLYAVIAHSSMPVERFVAETTSALKTRRGSVAWINEMCCGKWKWLVRDVLGQLQESEYVSALALSQTPPSKREGSMETFLLRKSFDLTVNFAGHVCASQLLWDVPPLQLLGLLCKDGAERAGLLKQLQSDFGALQEYEKASCSSPALQQYVQDLVIPSMTFVREILVMLD